MTDEEAEEVLHTAMTVGATRMQVMLTAEAAKLGGSGPVKTEPVDEAAAGPAADAPRGPEAAPAFAAAGVVEQAEGG